MISPLSKPHNVPLGDRVRFFGSIVKQGSRKGDHVNLIRTPMARIGGIAYVQYHKRIARALGSRLHKNGGEKEE